MNAMLLSILESKFKNLCADKPKFKNVTFEQCVYDQSLYEDMMYDLITTDGRFHITKYLEDARNYSDKFKEDLVLYFLERGANQRAIELFNIFGDFSKESQSKFVSAGARRIVFYLQNVHIDVDIEVLRETFSSNAPNLKRLYLQYFAKGSRIGKKLWQHDSFGREINRLKLIHPEFFDSMNVPNPWFAA